MRWCLNHDMFQQAFTLLSEQMPAFVCSHIFVQPTQKGVDFLASQLQNKGKTGRIRCSTSTSAAPP
ncbi:hypothetical protein NIA69_02735 [Gemmiger formicilis]|nr:hypothetical protein [Gemmiger formicilis]